MYRSLLLPGLIFDMDQLSLRQSLEIDHNTVASFYGAGGKTSLLLKLASEISEGGKKVLLTTTTKMYAPEGLPLFTLDSTQDVFTALREHFNNNRIAVLADSILVDGKLCGIEASLVKELHDFLKVGTLVEADGARGRSLKGYRDNEPVIPECSSLVIPVIGADALNFVIDEESVHCAAELLKAVPAASKGSKITEDIIAESFIYMGRLGKSQAKAAKIFYLLNKADKLTNFNYTALELLSRLKNNDHKATALLLTEAKNSNPVPGYFSCGSDSARPHVSSVVMAAGESKRMGKDKLNLPINGMSMLEATLKNLYDAGIKDIVVVVQPGSKWLKTVDRKIYKVVENQKYKSGMAESLKAGLNAVDHRSQGVIFSLADQPLVPPKLYSDLIDFYSTRLDLVTFPVYKEKRGNPVIFDRRTWPILQKLAGDQGGRAIIETLPESKIGFMETDYKAVVLDIDTPGDYKAIIKRI